MLTIPGTHPVAYLLPFPQTDMIYAVITNEVGLFGAVAVLLAYLLFVYRGFKAATLARDSFSKLMATGLSAVFALQVFVIVGGVTRVIPLTGVTLPFISYGGASIVANFVLLALLLLVSDRARRPDCAMNGQIVRLFGLFVVLFALLVVWTTRWTVIDASALNNNPLNSRDLIAQLRVKRGRILAANGDVLAKSVRHPGGTFSRTYPTGSLFAQPVGYANVAEGSAAGPGALPQRRPAGRADGPELGVRPARRHPAGRRRRRTRRSTPRPSRSPSRSWPAVPARWWRSTRRPARCSRCTPTPATTPTIPTDPCSRTPARSTAPPRAAIRPARRSRS